MKTYTRIEWSYRTSAHEDPMPVIEAEAREAYMTAEEYARKRAEVIGGEVVKRTRTVTLSDWEPA